MPSPLDLNYFVCTLGQAARIQNGTPYQNVNHLIDEQARINGHLPAVGFYSLTSQSSSLMSHILSFADVRKLSVIVAHLIKDHVDLSAGQTVSLLSASSPEFLLVWLALIRLGHPVLLIAPQCSPSAIGHLSKACDAPILFHDVAHTDLADRAGSASEDIDFPILTYLLPFDADRGVLELINQEVKSDIVSPSLSDSHIAYLHHSSGTSTGIPKPIPQSHRAAVGVLPSLPGSAHATFTTTPLYHGGVADLFRAWSSSALIWLFPSQHLPVTASNIISCLMASKSTTNSIKVPHIKYFSSVPYILQMMADDNVGLKQLQSMDIVGVGGAALPAEVGNKLVKNGVNLISRFGSAECGFLMSSHRDYEKDIEWQYLRHDVSVSELKFEPQDAGLSELVVLDGWPHMAKHNRDDGSFATADLFIPHPNIPHAWKYHSRADSQLTLVTGKKFDPAPLEDSITAASTLIDDVLIFGNGKPYPGILLFRSKVAVDATDAELIQEMAPIIERLNSESQGHARIPRNMLISMPFNNTPLEKSSKGTILRGRAEEVYDQQIENAYKKVSINANENISDEELPSSVLEIVKSVLGLDDSQDQTLDLHTDLFAHGVDSVACVQIRHALSQLLTDKSCPLPLTVVEDCGTVSRLSAFLTNIRHGKKAAKQGDQRELLSTLVENYSIFKTYAATNNGDSNNLFGKTSKGLHVLLTGPTGSLGSHMLQQLSRNPDVTKIYLLVRGATQHAARERVAKALLQRKLHISSEDEKKFVIMPCKLAEPRLGLNDGDYQVLTSKIDIVFHLAWSVNFLMNLQSFASTHLAGLQNLLNLTLSSTHPEPPKFLFCSSIASTSNLISKTDAKNKPIPESIVKDTSAAGPTGYALSKLAAELICANCAQQTSLNGHVTVLRVGQLSGDTKNGVWNKSEAYPLILGTSKVTGTLPNLGSSEKLSWLPVDIAAQGFIEAALHKDELGNNNTGKPKNQNDNGSGSGVQVLHLLNPSTKSTWTDFLKTILNQNNSSGTKIDLEIIPSDDWLNQLDQLQEKEETKDHPALKLLSFWRGAYGSKSDGLGTGDTAIVSESNQHQQDMNRTNDSDHTQANINTGNINENDDIDTSVNNYINNHHHNNDNDDNDDIEEEYTYEMTKSLQIMPSINPYIGGLNDEYLLKLWEWVSENC